MSHNHSSLKRQIYILMFIVLPLLSLFFLYLEHVTHFEFLLHVAAIPLEILLGAFLVERYLARTEQKSKLRQLMYIKSYMFRSKMRDVFILNFQALEQPKITIEQIKGASLEDLKRMKESVRHLRYSSAEDLEPIIDAYVQSQPVFHHFLEWAIENHFENIFQDMIFVLHFIQDVNLFKAQNPGKLFIKEAERQPELMAKVYKILGDGLNKFLDYAIELKEKQPDVLQELLADYQIASQMSAGAGVTMSDSKGEAGSPTAISFPGTL